MQSKDTQKTKVGRVSIRVRANGSINSRWRYQSTEFNLYYGLYTPERWEAAIAYARIIESDIVFDRFDRTLGRYGKVIDKPIPINNSVISEETKEMTLLEIWEQYKSIKSHTIATTTVKSDWARMERIFKRTEKLTATILDCEYLITEQLEYYATGTLIKPFKALRAAINYAIEKEQIVKNPLTKLIPLMLPGSEKDIRAFPLDEIIEILAAFADDRYLPQNSQYKHSHYWHYVRFRTLCGCRPSEAIALTWEDIKRKKDGQVNIVFNKGYAAGKLRKSTKTGVTRIFPCNSQMIEFLDLIPKTHPTLVFPSQSGNYIHSGNFLRRYWNPIVNALVADGLVDEYLPFYNLRHTYISTLVADKRIDVATVSTWVGNSPETIFDNYLASKKGVLPPEL